MTELEDRLRQELIDMAQQLVPADVRPLRAPAPRARSRRARWLVAAVAASAAAAIVAGLLVAGRSTSTTPGPTTRHRLVADPTVVATYATNRTNSFQSIDLVSLISGRVRLLAPVGTTNSLALSPDASAVFVVNLVHRQIVIQRISVATGRVSFVADGADPAVSPDSRYLAYATGPRSAQFSEVAVRNLRTGSTRVVNIGPLIRGGSLLATGQGIAWLGDGSQLVAIPQPLATLLDRGGKTTGRSAAAACGAQNSPRRMCLIVVDVTAAGLRARRVLVPVPLPARLVVSGSSDSGHELDMVGTDDRSVEAIDLSGAQARVRLLVRLPAKTYLWAISPSGDQVLYGGGTPAGFWVATVRAGHLVHAHRLNVPRTFGVDQVAW